MKIKIFILSLLAGFSVSVFAQQTQVYDNHSPDYKTYFKRNNAGDNWFVNLSAGAQVYNIDESAGAGFSDRAKFAPAFSVGKWLSPYWGVRLKGQGLSANSYAEETTGNFYKQDNDYVNVHVDAMCNVANYVGGYSPDKFFNFTPYVGMGWAHRFQLNDDAAIPVSPQVSGDYRRSSDAFSINGGIQLGFRLSNRVNLDLDFGITFVGNYFDRIYQKAENDNIVSAMGGITYKLGKTAFEAVASMDYAVVDALNGKINDLRKENEELSKRSSVSSPPVCPPCPQCPPVAPNTVKSSVINYVPNVVFFRINSSKVDDNQQVSIYNTASFMNESDGKIKVIGYADKDTGTAKYNLELSKKRAQSVAKELITKYNIPSEKITVEWKGCDEQPYTQNEWNRVVIMSSVK